ncbi:hypothetical protein SAMN05192529_1493 [Arachidicoccus rhizosphaerae]|uniref:Uncharacterized protein n=1 Tax=Arachidicoccus rhizosphaerae TaxID=551991 RepID=A0A1H4D892_9BACT|nr:hypothetical protein [Arachidicoccus rhizosphaerae]SEA68482.1 hypothetical protein SAMN05192529_1493 [Arachidicoccus rhizosphaerae]
MIVKLNKNQFDYLSYSLSEKQEVLKLKLKEISKENQFVLIEIDEEMADEIRDWASDELQRKGFGINYELTSEGKILEELIDLFYVE